MGNQMPNKIKQQIKRVDASNCRMGSGLHHLLHSGYPNNVSKALSNRLLPREVNVGFSATLRMKTIIDVSSVHVGSQRLRSGTRGIPCRLRDVIPFVLLDDI